MTTDPKGIPKAESIPLGMSGIQSLGVAAAAAAAAAGTTARPDSATVSVSALTRLSELPMLVSSLVKLGVSTTVRLHSGEKEKLRSTIAALNARSEIVSAALTLRGDMPVK